MPRNPDGTYTRAVTPYQPGTDISATEVNAEMDDIATALTGSVSVDGSTRVTGDLSMEGEGGQRHKHTNVARGTALTDYADVQSVQENAYARATASRTGSVLTLTTAPAPAGYTEGMQFFFRSPAHAGSGAYTSPSTLKVGTLVEKLILGHIPADAPIIVTYLKGRFHAASAKVGAVLPHNMPNDRLLFYHDGEIEPKSLAEDGDVMPAEPALKELSDLATSENEQKILTYGSTTSGGIVLTTVDRPDRELNPAVLGWDRDNSQLAWKSLSSKFVKAARVLRFDDTSRTISWTKPQKLHSARITLVGGGGAGGRQKPRGSVDFGLPGGGGETVVLFLTNDDLSEDTYKIEVGWGGAAPSGSATKGGNGGLTWIRSNSTALSRAAGGKGGDYWPNAARFTGILVGADGGETEDDDRGTFKDREILRISGDQGGLTFLKETWGLKDRIATGHGGNSYFGGGGYGTQSTRWNLPIPGKPGKNGGGGSGSFNMDAGAEGGKGFVIIESWVLA